MVFTTIYEPTDEQLTVQINYSVVKCILVSLHNRLKGENVKKHFSNLLYAIDDAQTYAYWHNANAAKEIFAARDRYVDYVLSFRK